jgi:putative transposase
MYPENNGEKNLVETRRDDESNLDPSEGSRGQAMELSYNGRISEVEELFKEIMKEPGRMFDMFRIDIKRACEKAVEQVISMELTAYLGRERYERKEEDDKNYRNGSYPRSFTAKGIGNLQFKVARDRNGEFHSNVINRYERYEEEIAHDIQAMFLSGMSTRSISLFSEHLIGRKVSSGEVSKINGELIAAVEQWRTRSLADMKIEYMLMDGVFFKFRVKRVVDGSTRMEIKRIPMLVVIGVTATKQRTFLAIQQGDKDSATTWREIFRDLKERGLNASDVKLGIMDGLQGLEKVFCEEFQKAKVQRCIVHVMRNVITKAPKAMRQEVTDSLRDIFYAIDRKSATERYDAFVKKYDDLIPSGVASLKRSIKSCLTFYDFPKEEWLSLRTTNIIERVNKEFKRRTNPMEILASERSAYVILCFVAFKMEANWRSAPFGKSNLPVLRNFTHNS